MATEDTSRERRLSGITALWSSGPALPVRTTVRPVVAGATIIQTG